jgi:hypothetical protein
MDSCRQVLCTSRALCGFMCEPSVSSLRMLCVLTNECDTEADTRADECSLLEVGAPLMCRANGRSLPNGSSDTLCIRRMFAGLYRQDLTAGRATDSRPQ